MSLFRSLTLAARILTGQPTNPVLEYPDCAPISVSSTFTWTTPEHAEDYDLYDNAVPILRDGKAPTKAEGCRV